MNDGGFRHLLVVEDDVGTREALTLALRERGWRTTAVASGEDAGSAVRVDPLGFDTALVDLGLPGVSGAETIRMLRRASPDLPVLVLTVFEDPAQVVGAIEAGASGYLLKGSTLDEIVLALDRVADGLCPVSPAVAGHLLRVIRRNAEDTGAENPLTRRETDVLDLLVQGHTYPAIAGALAIGLGTVQTHIKSIYRKLEVSSKAEAASVAMSRRLVD